MPVLMLGGLGVCAGYAFAVWVKGQEPPKEKIPASSMLPLAPCLETFGHRKNAGSFAFSF